MGSGLAKPCEISYQKHKHTNFHVQDLRAPLFGRRSSEMLDPKANVKYCTPQLFENILSELTAPGPDADIPSLGCMNREVRKSITEGHSKPLMVSS